MARPATVTGPEAVAKAEVIARLMQARFCGLGFREIAAAEGISPATACRWYWRAMRSIPHDPARLRRRAARERNTV
jgi:hypothetical protein